jgi:glucose/arabinose dehydrogenase
VARRFATRGGLILLGALTSLLLALAGCATTDPSTSDGTSGTSVPMSTTTASSPSSSTSTPASIVGSGYRAGTVVDDLRIPWEMRFLPDGRLLVTEREGRVVIADVGTGEVTEVGRIDVSARGEGGLMGLALDPGFAENGTIYVSYTYSDGGGGNRVSRFVLGGLTTGTPRLGDETVLVDGIPAGTNHDGSRVAFGPDGYLWVTTGDAGDGDLAQRMDSLAGKVLRMSPEGRPAPDNPFLDQPYPFSLIYTLGHRNPQGLAFHPRSGAPFVTEHGPSDNDEVNRLYAGGNYGWPDLRGMVQRPGFVDPLATWSPTIAPAGAIFCAEGTMGDLGGAFLFVTLKEQDLRVLVPTGLQDFAGAAEERVLFDRQFGRLRAIAQGPDGSLYVGTSNHDGRGDPESGDDRIIRIEPEV